MKGMKKFALLFSGILVFCSIMAQNTDNIGKFTYQGPHYGFIENKGQISDQFDKPNPEVKFLLSIGNGMNVQLKKNSFSYDTYKIEFKEKKKDGLPNKLMAKLLQCCDT
jgi:hypothetical protein